MADITPMDRIGIPTYVSIRPDSKSLSVDSGKGTTKEQAKCSASMEALERWALDEVPIASFPAPGKNVLRNFALNRGRWSVPVIKKRQMQLISKLATWLRCHISR
mgnify:CR=1 FL=1